MSIEDWAEPVIQGLSSLPTSCKVGQIIRTPLSDFMRESDSWFVFCLSIKHFSYAAAKYPVESGGLGYSGTFHDVPYSPGVLCIYDDHLRTWNESVDRDRLLGNDVSTLLCEFCSVDGFEIDHFKDCIAFEKLLTLGVEVNMGLEGDVYEPISPPDKPKAIIEVDISANEVYDGKALISASAYCTFLEALTDKTKVIYLHNPSVSVMTKLVQAKQIVDPNKLMSILVRTNSPAYDWEQKPYRGVALGSLYLDHHIKVEITDNDDADHRYYLFSSAPPHDTGIDYSLTIDPHVLVSYKLMRTVNAGRPNVVGPFVFTYLEEDSAKFNLGATEYCSPVRDPMDGSEPVDLNSLVLGCVNELTLNPSTIDLSKISPLSFTRTPRVLSHNLLDYTIHRVNYNAPSLDVSCVPIANGRFTVPLIRPQNVASAWFGYVTSSRLDSCLHLNPVFNHLHGVKRCWDLSPNTTFDFHDADGRLVPYAPVMYLVYVIGEPRSVASLYFITELNIRSSVDRGGTRFRIGVNTPVGMRTWHDIPDGDCKLIVDTSVTTNSTPCVYYDTPVYTVILNLEKSRLSPGKYVVVNGPKPLRGELLIDPGSPVLDPTIPIECAYDGETLTYLRAQPNAVSTSTSEFFTTYAFHASNYSVVGINVEVLRQVEALWRKLGACTVVDYANEYSVPIDVVVNVFMRLLNTQHLKFNETGGDSVLVTEIGKTSILNNG